MCVCACDARRRNLSVKRGAGGEAVRFWPIAVDSFARRMGPPPVALDVVFWQNLDKKSSVQIKHKTSMII